LKKLDGFNLSNVHFKWSPLIKPVLFIDPSEEVEISIPDSSTNQIKENFTTDDLSKIDQSKFDGAVGPIYINGAKPGDAISITLKKIEIGDWGWSAILSNFGVLKGRFKDRLIIWKIKNGFAKTKGEFLKDVSIPTRPFLGVIGTAPPNGELPMIPPHSSGGNMDNRLLNEGSNIILPVRVDGALLSLSDPHAAQGDGEICGTAIETFAKVVIKVDLIKNANIDLPMAKVNLEDNGSHLLTMGISENPLDAMKEALLSMIKELNKRGFSSEEAYVLCSVAGSLKMSEVVDMPNYVVSLTIPEKIIEKY
jgi:acetamidase/formamidase